MDQFGRSEAQIVMGTLNNKSTIQCQWRQVAWIDSVAGGRKGGRAGSLKNVFATPTLPWSAQCTMAALIDSKASCGPQGGRGGVRNSSFRICSSLDSMV